MWGEEKRRAIGMFPAHASVPLMAPSHSEAQYILVTTDLTKRECPSDLLADTVRASLRELFGHDRPRCDVFRLQEVDEDFSDEEPRRVFLLKMRDLQSSDIPTILAELRCYCHLIVEDEECEMLDEEDASDHMDQFDIPELENWRGIPVEDEEEWRTGEPPDAEEEN